MRPLRILGCLALVCGLVLGVESPDERKITDPKTLVSEPMAGSTSVPVEDLFFTRTVTGPSWSPSGKEIAFTTNLTGRLNLWKVPSQGGWPVQLSPSDDRQVSAQWSPDGKWISYQQDRGGGEYFDIYLAPSEGGEVLNLTNTPDVTEIGPLWSPDATKIAFRSKSRSAPNTNVGIFDLKSRSIRLLTQETNPRQNWAPTAWSSNGQYLFAVRVDAGLNDSDVYRLNYSTGQAENLTRHQGDIRYNLGDVSPDGATLLISSNETGGYGKVAILDVQSKKLTWVTDHLQWEAFTGNFSSDGKLFTYIVNEDGRTSLYTADLKSRKARKLDFPEGVSIFAGNRSAFSPSGDRLLISHQGAQRPEDLWVYNVATRTVQQITNSAPAGLNPKILPPSHLVHYRSFDDKIISAFLYIPFNLRRDSSNPGIVLVHGGPAGQAVDSFNPTIAALASRGYVVIAPNPRGSTGYGSAFQKAIYQDLGGGDLQDEVYAARFLVATGYVNERKIGITGSSYGGYMTLMALSKTPEVWAAGVEQYGIIDWLSMLRHSDPRLQEYQKSLLGDPEKNRTIYEQASPKSFVRNINAPLLVLHGVNDVRVPKEEAEQVVAILTREGKTVEAHYYPDEGHGFTKRENQIDSVRRTISWFDKYLKATSN